MGWALTRFSLTKAVPLTISRGTTAAVVRLELRLERDGLVGRGETGGFETGHRGYSTDAVEIELQTLLPRLEGLDPSVPQGFEPLLADLTPPARCALDLALWDWRGRRLQAPVWQLWGLDGARSVATSVTLGLAAVEQVLQRLQRWRELMPVTRVKLKLGSPDGLEHDRALLSAVADAMAGDDRRPAAELQVDANGGWSRATARRWMERLVGDPRFAWLEQPLAPNDQEGLDELAGLGPVALDESLDQDPSLRDHWGGWQVRRPVLEGDPRPLLQDLQRGRPKLMLSTAFETGIGARWLALLARLQQQGPTPVAPGFAPGWTPSGPLFASEPEQVWAQAAQAMP